MRYPFLLSGQLTFTTALLGAALTGCAAEGTDTDGQGNSSAEIFSDGEKGTANPGGETQGWWWHGGHHGPHWPHGPHGSGSSSSGGTTSSSSGGTTSSSSSSSSTTSSSTTSSSTSVGSGGGGQGGAGGGGAGGGNAGGGLFQQPAAWTKDVSGLTKDAKSTAITDWLSNAGGWGSGVLRIDFGLTILQANNSTPKKSFIATDEFYSPDCDQVSFPVPANGSLEAESGYSCDGDGDCHLIVVHTGENKLYEMWRANITGGTFYGGCAAVWDLGKSYPDNLRGEGCTSADAGGFPIAAMVFTPEEVQAGAINHALRFILPNARIRDNVYVHPGTHSTFATSGGTNAPPYGVRFRLRQDFPLASLPSDGARTIAKALQKYGMFLADGGTIAMTGSTDKYSSVKWDDLGVDPYSLSSIDVTDMEVVDMGAPISWSGDCDRNP